VTTQRVVGVEVLTVTDCPHRSLTLGRLRLALDRIGLTGAAVTERVIDDPTEAIGAGMHGSPTVLIDGPPVHGIRDRGLGLVPSVSHPDRIRRGAQCR
jgi:hypothetical protein